MDQTHAVMALGAALGLGLLVGLQRERADSAIAGIRTFPLITLLGVLCSMIADRAGGWVLGAGLLAVAGATAVGNALRPRPDKSPGITTEVAALVMFAVGASLWIGPLWVGVAAGTVCAVLLHLKERMHAFAGRLDERDVRAIMQFAAVTFIVLPILPDRSYGPGELLNPRQVWLMVVLVVGMSLAGYAALKILGGRAGAVAGGLLGGVVSSTAATASFARRAGGDRDAAGPAALAIVLASCVVYARVLVEVGLAGRSLLMPVLPPVLAMLAAGALASWGVYHFTRRDGEGVGEPKNPAELKAALVFAGVYALVTVAAASAQRFAGTGGLMAVAAISGLTDMDAITLSTARLAEAGTVGHDAAWRAIVVAVISNLAFKAGMAGVLGGARLLWLAAFGLGAQAAAGGAMLLLWPG